MAIRWGIVGCGDVTEVKSGPGFQLAEGSELVAVMRRNGDLAADYARRHKVGKWYDDARKLINDPEVDAVYVATPVSSHLQYALMAAEAGKPAYVEKPMGRNTEEAERMVTAFAKAGQKLFIAYYRRALPRFLKAQELIDSGRLGKVTGVTYRFSEPLRRFGAEGIPWRLSAEQSGGGLIMDLGCHTLDAIDFLLGPLSDVHGSAANLASAYNVEDTVVMHFRAGGVPGTASWHFAGSRADDTITVIGTGGTLELSTFGNEALRLSGESGTETFDLPNPKHVQQPLIQTVVDDLLGKGSCRSTGESALRTTRVLDRVLEGYYGTRNGRFWEHSERWPGRKTG